MWSCAWRREIESDGYNIKPPIEETKGCGWLMRIGFEKVVLSPESIKTMTKEGCRNENVPSDS